MSCGEINFLEGGALKDVSIIGGVATGTQLRDCSASALEVTNLRSLDTSSTERIAEAMGRLSTLNIPLTDLIARSLSAYGLCDEAFINTVKRALGLIPDIEPSVAAKMLRAISHLSPAVIAAAIDSYSSEVVARAYADCLTKLTDTEAASFFSELMNPAVAQVIGRAIATLSPEERRNLATLATDEGVATVIAMAIRNLPRSTLNSLFSDILTDQMVAKILTTAAQLDVPTRETFFQNFLTEGITDQIAQAISELPAVRLNELVSNAITEQMASAMVGAMGNVPYTQLVDLAITIFNPDVVKVIADALTRLPAENLKPLADVLYQITHHGCVPVPLQSCCVCNAEDISHECSCTCDQSVPLMPAETGPCDCNCCNNNSGECGNEPPIGGVDGGELP